MFNQFKPVEVPSVIRPNSPTFNEVYSMIKEYMKKKDEVRRQIDDLTNEKDKNYAEINKIREEMTMVAENPLALERRCAHYKCENLTLSGKIATLEERMISLNCDANQMIMVLQLIKETDKIRNNTSDNRSATAPIENTVSTADDRRHRRGSK